MSTNPQKSNSTPHWFSRGWVYYPSEGFPRLAYLGPGAGWDGGREDFEGSRRSGVSIRAQGPWALGPGPMGPWPMGPGPRARGLFGFLKTTFFPPRSPRKMSVWTYNKSRSCQCGHTINQRPPNYNKSTSPELQ